jgi:hypothetical protein
MSEEGAMTEERTTSPGVSRAPWLLGLIGLILMLGGYQLLNYAPPPRDTEQARLWEKMQQLGEQDPTLGERLRQVGRPYRAAGTIAVYGGLLLFIAAGIKMYHHRPPPAENEGPEEAAS